MSDVWQAYLVIILLVLDSNFGLLWGCRVSIFLHACSTMPFGACALHLSSGMLCGAPHAASCILVSDASLL